MLGSDGKFGWQLTGNSSFSRERENADGSAWSEGIVSAGNNLNVNTGNNLNVVGGQLEGDTVKMDVGNDLNIQSLQDSDNYDYEKLSTSVGGSITLGPGSGGSANFSTSKTDMESNWASVTDQSGIYAGSGGFDITVGNNTDLKGGVIASDAEDKSKNRLDTGTISFEDIENKADFNVDHVSINVSVGSSLGYTPTPGAPSIYNNNGKDSSTTKSAVEEGTLIVRDTDKQTQDVNDLSRDTENANDPLGQIFDKQKEQDRMEALDLVKDITAQAHDVINKYDSIRAEEKYKGLSESEQDELKKKAEKALNDKGIPATDDAINNYIINQFVQNDGIGNMGGSFSKGLDAASSIISGIITGDITGGLAGASAPYLAGLIKEQTYRTDDKGNIIYGPDGNPIVNEEANRIAHAILGAAVAAAQGNSALAGGAGALTGEVMADIIRETLYGKDVKDLTEAEKQNISNLAQIASGLAVAAGGGSVSDVGTAASASKNAVENNYLTAQDIIDFVEKLENVKTEDEKKELIEKLKELDQRQQKKAENTAISQKKQLEQLNQLKELLVSDKCNETCKELISYSISELEPVATNSARHGYNITKYAWVEAILLLVTDDPLSSMALGSIVKNSNKAKIPVSGASVAADVSKIDEMIAKVESSAGKGAEGQAGNVIKGFSQTETKIINEAQGILDSKTMDQIQQAYASGQPVTVVINGRTIQYEPNLPGSGMTMFGENGFLIGPEAFKSQAELQKTLLHELYRLNTSNSASGVSGALASQETKAAYDFAEKASSVLGNK